MSAPNISKMSYAELDAMMTNGRFAKLSQLNQMKALSRMEKLGGNSTAAPVSGSVGRVPMVRADPHAGLVNQARSAISQLDTSTAKATEMIAKLKAIKTRRNRKNRRNTRRNRRNRNRSRK
jgi:hypothetical protein